MDSAVNYFILFIEESAVVTNAGLPLPNGRQRQLHDKCIQFNYLTYFTGKHNVYNILLYNS